MSIKFRGLIALLVVIGLSGLVMSCGGSSRPAGLLLVISQGATDVNSYGINLNTGVLTQINTAAPVAANSIPTAIVLDPSGNFAYVANATNGGGPGSITAYSVKSDGIRLPASTRWRWPLIMVDTFFSRQMKGQIQCQFFLLERMRL